GGGLDLPCVIGHLLPVHPPKHADLSHDRAHVADCLDNIAGAGFSLCADHGRPLVDPAERLAKVTCTADEGDLEQLLIDMILFVCRCQDLALVDHIDPEDLQHLRLDKMADPDLPHDRNGDRRYDLKDLL